MFKSLHAFIPRIAISSIVAIAMIASSATITRSQIQNMGLFKSRAECEEAMQALLRSGRISWYNCYPSKKTNQIHSLPAQRQLRVNILSPQLNKKWKHKSLFGIKTPKNNPSAIDLAYYRQAIVYHLRSPQTIAHGTYQRVPGSKVYFNPITNLAVILDRKGNFVSGFRLLPGTPQFRNFINEGVLR
jgi:Colicin D